MITAAVNTHHLDNEPAYGWNYYSGVMVRLKAGQQAVKRASFATVASLGSFSSDVTDAGRIFARDAPAVARRLQQDLGSAALHVHHSARDAIVTAGTGLCHATQQVGWVFCFLRQCVLQSCQGNLQVLCRLLVPASTLCVREDMSSSSSCGSTAKANTGIGFLWCYTMQ